MSPAGLAMKMSNYCEFSDLRSLWKQIVSRDLQPIEAATGGVI